MLVLLLACADAPTDPAAVLTDPGDAPTWYADVAPIVAEHCTGCHAEGAIGPFPLDTYAAAAPMAPLLADAVEAGTMPPWSAKESETCEPRFGWKGDLRLDEDQKGTLRAWADAGAPEGDPASAAVLPEPPRLDLDRVDQELTPVQAYTTGGDTDEYVCFTIDPGLTETAWLTGVQVVPSNGQVVHHVLAFIDTTGASADLGGADGTYDCFGASVPDAQLAMVWVPGATAFEVPEGSAIQVPAGARYVLQVHYHPAGVVAAEDLTRLQLRYQSSWPSSLTFLTLLGNAWSAASGLAADPDDRTSSPEFRIPANSGAHTESMSVALTGLPDLALFLVGTHMHYVGVDMQIDLLHGDPVGDEPDQECLLQTAWDFDWQRAYVYDAPIGEGVMVHGSDTLALRCSYDNTLDNPGVRRSLEDAGLTEPQDVFLGESTLDEMCLGMFGVVYAF